jgi:hypothetical protein
MITKQTGSITPKISFPPFPLAGTSSRISFLVISTDGPNLASRYEYSSSDIMKKSVTEITPKQRLFQIGARQHQSQDSVVKLYCTGRIRIFARLIAVLIAVLVLFIPVILFLLTSMNRACMAVVVLSFVFIFSVVISMFTDARDKEIFVGTATYCAVLVTFLGNLQSSAK